MTERPNDPVDLMDKPLEELAAICEKVNNYLGPVMVGVPGLPLNSLLRMILYLRYLKDLGTELARMANVELPKVAELANKLMLSDPDFDSIRLLGHNFTPDERVFVSVRESEKPLLIAWMKKDEEGRELVKEDVHHKSLESFVIKRIKEDPKDGKPPHVNVFTQPSVKVTKARS